MLDADTEFLKLFSQQTLHLDLRRFGVIAASFRLGAIEPGGGNVVDTTVPAGLASGLVPISERFFAGGDNSVRGYDYESLGPKDSNGEVAGGRYLVVGSAEYEHRLWGKWGAAVFYDAGNALDAIDDKLKHGAGIGLRWQSPVGPVRVDVASALSEDNNPLRLHVTVGSDL